MTYKRLEKLFVICFVAFSANLTTADEDFNSSTRKAVNRSISLIEKSMAEYLNHRECFSCHHQALPVIALTTADRYGFKIDRKKLKAQLDHTLKHFRKNVSKYREGKGTGGQVDTAGYGLWALAEGGVEKSEYTEAVTGYLLKRDRKRKFWRRSSERPPSEASNFTTTSLAINALQNYGTKEQAKSIDERILRVKNWLNETKCRDTEDTVFKINALVDLKMKKELISKLAESLLKTQNPDGGWSQLADMKSDAYATATVLFAMAKSKTLKPGDPRYMKAIKFLVNTQNSDGSWYVKSRSDPFQEYFESGFPHEADQFISITATCWAVIALAEANNWSEKEKK